MHVADIASANDLLAKLIEIPSVNPFASAGGTGEHDCAQFVSHWFADLPVMARVTALAPGRANALITLPGTGVGHLLLHAHTDTVAPTMSEPFRARRVGNRLYGLGACDDKGSLAAMMLALRYLVNSGAQLPCSVTLAAVAGEEYDQLGTRRLVESMPDPYTAAIVGEPTRLQPIISSNGEMWFRVVVLGKSAHASTPHLGQNALYGMADVLGVIRNVLIPRYAQRRNPDTGAPTISPGILQGGMQINVVPDRCELQVDRRLAPGENPQSAWQEIVATLRAELGSAWHFEVESPFHLLDPLDTPAEHAVVRALGNAITAAGFDGTTGAVPYGTDASLLAAAGVPAVIFGPGDIAVAHTPDEHVDLVEVTHAAEILVRTITQLTA